MDNDKDNDDDEEGYDDSVDSRQDLSNVVSYLIWVIFHSIPTLNLFILFFEIYKKYI